MAGQGRRLLPLTEGCPKALICCDDGISIFEHIVKAFYNISFEVTIIPVIGHGYLKVLDEIDRLKGKVKFRSITNPFYSSNGPLISFWLGLLQSRSDRLIVLNGDTLIRKTLVYCVEQWFKSNTNSLKPTIGVCITKPEGLDKDDMKILLSKNKEDVVCRVGKDLLHGPDIVKSAGVLCIKDSYTKNLLMARLNTLLMDEKSLQTKYYWHNILNEVNDILNIELINVDHNSFYEVDTKYDLKNMS